MKNRLFPLPALMAPLLLAISAAAQAHHSPTMFDFQKQATVTGTVREFQWTNPHSYIQLLVNGEGGDEIQWSVEIGSPSLNINMGWRKNSVKVGDVVTMNLAPARNGKPYGTLRVLTFANGQTLDGVAARVGARPGGAAPAPPSPAVPAASKEP